MWFKQRRTERTSFESTQNYSRNGNKGVTYHRERKQKKKKKKKKKYQFYPLSLQQGAHTQTTSVHAHLPCIPQSKVHYHFFLFFFFCFENNSHSTNSNNHSQAKPARPTTQPKAPATARAEHGLQIIMQTHANDVGVCCPSLHPVLSRADALIVVHTKSITKHPYFGSR